MQGKKAIKKSERNNLVKKSIRRVKAALWAITEAEQFDLELVDDSGEELDLIYVPAHCDNRVLHSPGYCKYCDAYPKAQKRRIDLGVDFTDETPGTRTRPCPALSERSWEDINGWGGNQPAGPGVSNNDRMELKKVERFSSKAFYGDRKDQFRSGD